MFVYKITLIAEITPKINKMTHLFVTCICITSSLIIYFANELKDKKKYLYIYLPWVQYEQLAPVCKIDLIFHVEKQCKIHPHPNKHKYL